ncbi:MAG: SDR family NAD(P)-dependent oxidoreductase [Methanogenium sp.]|jgi:3-oxoacyl-[acyl-carrier protein] reductase
MNIIITGSSRGIGNAISERCIKLGGRIYGVTTKTDVRKSNCIDYILTDPYNIDVLINNAGIIKVGNVSELTNYDWKKQFNVNVHGTFNCCKTYIKHCIERKIKGKIINIASTAGLGARPGRAAYAATKAAIINFSLSLSEELKDYGIKVYCVCPSAVDTDMRHYINPDDDFINMLKPADVADFVYNLIINGEKLDGQILTIK